MYQLDCTGLNLLKIELVPEGCLHYVGTCAGQ